MTTASASSSSLPAGEFRTGLVLVAGSALFWSFGGTIARFLGDLGPWTIVFWRTLFSASFLMLFMLWREGPRETLAMFRSMGWAGLAVAICFAVASSTFVVALQYTTVANILLTQAAAPLFAALLAWAVFGERVSLPTWFAIAAVICGVAIMVSASFSGHVSPLGDGLALIIPIAFSAAIVITRHHPEVRMMPAVCLGSLGACFAALFLKGGLSVGAQDLFWLVMFGAVNLGAGLAMFVTGARLIPAALAALISTLEPVLGPIWVWLVHGEVPGPRTVLGGGIVFLALFVHILTDWRRQRGKGDAIIAP